VSHATRSYTARSAGWISQVRVFAYLQESCALAHLKEERLNGPGTVS
jgi:hypothetical protein